MNWKAKTILGIVTATTFVALFASYGVTSNKEESTTDFNSACAKVCAAIGWNDSKWSDYVREHNEWGLDDMCESPCSEYRPADSSYSASMYTSPEPASSGIGCCKICSRGKACGDSCIARDKTCHKEAGCACNQ